MTTMIARVIRSRRRRAVAAVMVLVTLPVLFGMAALTIDVGAMYVTRADLQVVADAAALSGASAYTTDAMTEVRVDQWSYDALFEVRRTVHRRVHRLEAYNGSLGAERTVVESHDIAMGWIDTTSATSPIQRWAVPSAFNAVQVTVRRTSDGPNGPINLFFAPIFGQHYSETAATAVAVFNDRFSGYETASPGPRILPFTIDIRGFEEQLARGDDRYAFDAEAETVSSGTDRAGEIVLYPGEYAPGNYGLLNIGLPSQSSAELFRQIDYGIEPEEFELETGSSELTFFDDDGDPVTYTMSGSTGMRAAIEAPLQELVGQLVAYFVHDQTWDNGSNAMYRIVGIRFGRLMHANINRRREARGLWVQPVPYFGPGVRTNLNAPRSDGNAGRIVLAR